MATIVTLLLIGAFTAVGAAVNLFVGPGAHLAPALFAVPILVAAHRWRDEAVGLTTFGAILAYLVSGPVRSGDWSDWPLVTVVLLTIGYLAVVLSRQRLETDRRAREAERANERIRRLQAITDVALTHSAVDDVLRDLLDRVVEILAVDVAVALLLDAESQLLEVRAVSGIGAEGIGAEIDPKVRIPANRGLAGRVLTERRPIVADAVANSDLLIPLFRDNQIRGLLGAPLIVDDRAIGVLMVGAVRANRFTDEEAGLLRLVADRAALAIDRARLFEAEHVARADAERERTNLKAIIHQLPAGVLIADARSGKLLLGNEWVTQIWRDTCARELCIYDHDQPPIFHQDGRPYDVDELPMVRSIRFGEIVTAEEVRIERGDGTTGTLSVNASPIRDVDGRVTAAVAVFTDLTERRWMEEALRASEERFRDIATTIPDWIWEVDAEGRYTYSNPSVQGILGYAPEEVVGKHLLEIVFPGDGPEISGILGEMFRGRRRFHNLSKHAVAKDGKDVWIETSGIPLIDERGELVGYRGVDRDVTERKYLEERLLRAERLGMAGRIAGRVAHDLNDLLSPLVGYPDLIRAQLPANHPVLPYCDAMLESALQMADINQHLLTLGRRGRPGDDAISVNRIVEQVIDSLTNRPESLTLDVDLAPDLLPVVGSSSQLVRVIENLVTNAREAMCDVGELSLVTENVYVDEPGGAYNQVAVGEYVRVKVRDTGTGIAPEILDKIFDPFFTTKPTRSLCESGLGLSIVQAIVDDHQGYVDVETSPWRGTTFSVYLPVDREVLRESHGEGLSGGSETILVVDDDVELREYVERSLETLGYHVQAVVSGEEAIAFLARNVVGLVILDMIMPSGMDGAETYRRIAKVHPGQRAIILSGYPESERTRAAQALGAGQFLRKPVTLAKLARTVRRELDHFPSPVTPD